MPKRKYGSALQNHLDRQSKKAEGQSSAGRANSSTRRAGLTVSKVFVRAIAIIGIGVIWLSAGLFGKLGDGHTNFGDPLGMIGVGLGGLILLLAAVVWAVAAIFRAIWRGISG